MKNYQAPDFQYIEEDENEIVIIASGGNFGNQDGSVDMPYIPFK